MRKKKVLIASFIGILISLGCIHKTPHKESMNDDEREEILQRGSVVVGATFGALSNRLLKALEAGGVANAVNQCQVDAMPITDSLSLVFDVNIRRTSLNLRNHKNTPDRLERIQLEEYDSLFKMGGPIVPILDLSIPGYVNYYAPIFIGDLCTRCHGEVGKTLANEDYKIIQRLYPEDAAIGYKAGDLRGMWTVKFKR